MYISYIDKINFDIVLIDMEQYLLQLKVDDPLRIPHLFKINGVSFKIIHYLIFYIV